MGNACCGNDDDSKKNSELEKYIKTHHINKYPHKCPKLGKQIDKLLRQDFGGESQTYKSKVVNEILDETARKQDMQVPESINLALIELMSEITNTSLNSAALINAGISAPGADGKMSQGRQGLSHAEKA